MTAGTPTTLVAKEYVLAGAKGEHCAASMTWSATYALSAPNSGEVGASQGSQATALCKKNEATCNSLYNFGQSIVGAKFQSPSISIGTATPKVITCTTGSIVGKTTQNAGIPLVTELKNLAFGTCAIGLHACTVKVEGLPYTTAGMTAGAGGNGWWSTPLHLFVECATENIRGCNYEKRASLNFFGGTFGNAKVTMAPLLKEVSGTENCARYARPSAIFLLTEPTEAAYLTH